MRKLLGMLAAAALVGSAVSGVQAVNVFAASSGSYGLGSVGPVQPCNLAPASSVANARIKATCVAARPSAQQTANAYRASTHTTVPADACHRVGSYAFIFDCGFRVTVSGQPTVACSGTVRVRGASRDPSRLATRLRGYGCVS
jgi:hypothetical protein